MAQLQACGTVVGLSPADIQIRSVGDIGPVIAGCNDLFCTSDYRYFLLGEYSDYVEGANTIGELKELEGIVPHHISRGYEWILITETHQLIYIIRDDDFHSIKISRVGIPALHATISSEYMMVIPYKQNGIYFAGFGRYSKTEFTRFFEDIEFIDCVAGCSQLFALARDGSVYVAGGGWYEGYACAMDDDYFTSQTPVRVPLNFRVRRVEAFGATTFFLDHSNRLFACGRNDCFECGIGEVEFPVEVTEVPKFTDDEIVAITGFENAYVTTKNGAFFSAGSCPLLRDGDRSFFQPCPILNEMQPTHVIKGNESYYFVKDDGFRSWTPEVSNDGEYRVPETGTRSLAQIISVLGRPLSDSEVVAVIQAGLQDDATSDSVYITENGHVRCNPLTVLHDVQEILSDTGFQSDRYEEFMIDARTVDARKHQYLLSTNQQTEHTLKQLFCQFKNIYDKPPRDIVEDSDSESE